MDCHDKLLIEGSSFVVYSLLKSMCQLKTRCIKKFEFEKGSRDRNKK